MFGLISKKKLLKTAFEIYVENDTAEAHSENDLYYRMGNANALGVLCSRLDMHLIPAVVERFHSEASDNA